MTHSHYKRYALIDYQLDCMLCVCVLQVPEDLLDRFNYAAGVVPVLRGFIKTVSISWQNFCVIFSLFSTLMVWS